MTKIILWIKIIWAALSSRSNQAFYDKISTFYDDVYVEHNVHAKTIITMLNEIYSLDENKTLILDLGCGTGMMTTLLSEKGFKVVGVDLSLSSLCVHQDNHPTHKLIQADANFLPIADGTFHSVVCLGVWRHFPDVEKILNEVSRILTNDGSFIVGYFPPALAGSIHLNQNWLGKLLIRFYTLLTKSLGYIDRADFSLEEETVKIAKRKFKKVSNVKSAFNKDILLAQYPLKPIQEDKIKTKTQYIDQIELDKILRCPFCVATYGRIGQLKLSHNNWLICQEPKCNCKYPIHNSIPLLLREEGEKWSSIPEENLPVSFAKCQ
jgi:ubiquinone/menaquinone biosynthesis C-methylase UbiE/uncharacterized protein YbaR (Trm112 family)